MEIHQSALTNHVASKNHMIDWEGVRLLAKEPDWKKRGVKEAIFIRKAGTHAINRDGGAPPSSRSFLEAAVPRYLVSLCIRSSDEGSSQSRNMIG